MFKQTSKKVGANNSNFIWKMRMVHINRPFHAKTIRDFNRKSKNGRHNAPWLSLVAFEI